MKDEIYCVTRQYGKTYRMFNDSSFRKISLLERFLLLFKKPIFITDKDGNVISTITYKKMFGKIYVISEKFKIVKEEKE